ncbi:unnamed protein product [Cuscuta europaea]|uniref:Uncharacterized protein n=2 Tax=Cuscuta europaea TaxID=41803 RepID=A0A9P0ZGA1_CUSEU|nr:unnamed protein product [Cuscuta europaea]
MESTPQSSVQMPPTVNLTRAYTLAVQTPSFSEIWTKFHHDTISEQNIDVAELNFEEETMKLKDVLKLSHDDIEVVLSEIGVDNFSQLVFNFFNHSEETARKCLLLSESIRHARRLYDPLDKLIETVDKYSLSQDQCDVAFDVFHQIDKIDNPFPGSNSIFNDMHNCYFQLKKQIDLLIGNSRSKLQLLRHATRGCTICFLVVAVGVATCAILIATPALLILIATPVCPAFFPMKINKRESARLVQLDGALRETFVLDSYLETLDCLVDPLHNSVEDLKRNVRFVLERSMDKYIIQEVLKQLQRKNQKFVDQLICLEVHLCLCFTAINRARSVLFNYLLFHQSHPS